MIKDIKRRGLHRAKIIEGQVKALEKQIDDEAYCMDIITQSLAIQKSLASLNKLMLENHLRTHLQHMLSSGDEKKEAQVIGEMLDLYELNNIRGK